MSTEEQAERGTSLADQARRCEAFSQERGWVVVDRFIDDGVSGATTDRPALGRLLAAASLRRFDVVVATDPDRLSRDLVDGLVLERELAARSVETVYLIQPSMGTLERQLRGVIAEEERRKIRDRMSRGLRAVAEAGFWPGGPPPYGYRIARTDKARAQLEINPEEAAILKALISAFVDDRLSTHEIATVLNERGAPTPAASRRSGNRGSPHWTHRKVRDALTSAGRASGAWTYGQGPASIAVEIPPIVSEARLRQLRSRLEETSTGPTSPTRRHFFLFARRITSPCGAPMYGYARPDGTGHAYRCAMRSMSRGPHPCDCRPVNAIIVETAAWDTIVTELTDPDRLAHLAGLALNASTDSGVEDLAALERRIRRIENALASKIAELLAGGAEPAIITRVTRQLEEQLGALREHRARVIEWNARREDQAGQLQRIHRLARSAHAALLNPSDLLRSQVVELLNTKIRVLHTEPCPTCAGKGLLPRGSQPEDPAARRRTGNICTTCRRTKSIPILEISGLLPLIDDLGADPDAPAIPFRLRSAG